MTSDLDKMSMNVRAYCSARDWDRFHSPKDLAIGISTEAAELLELFRFTSLEEQKQILVEKREHVEDELADVLYFVLRFADLNGIDLHRAFEHKMAKNEVRYPVSASRGTNKKYTELDTAR